MSLFYSWCFYTSSIEDPTWKFSILIWSIADFTFDIGKFSFSFLFIVNPFGFDYLAVRPFNFTLPVFFIIFELASINSTILIFQFSFSIHHIIFPLANVHSAINPFVFSMTLKYIFTPFTFIIWIIWPVVVSFTLF